MDEDNEATARSDSGSEDENMPQHNIKENEENINEIDVKAEDHNKDEATSKPTPRYDLKPLYVREMLDAQSHDVLFRRTSTEPFQKRTYREQSVTNKFSHVIEITSISFTQHKMTYWRFVEPDEVLDKVKIAKAAIRIISPLLQQVLNTVIKGYPELDLFNPRTYIERPYQPIMQYIKELKASTLMTPKEGLEEECEECNKHVDYLLNVIESELGQTWTAEKVHHQQSPPVATFEYYWIFFKPGTIVYRRLHDIWSAWVVKSLKNQFWGERLTL